MVAAVDVLVFGAGVVAIAAPGAGVVIFVVAHELFCECSNTGFGF